MAGPNPKPKIVFTPEQLDLARRLDDEGTTQKKMAKALGISLASFKRHIRPLLRPIPLRPPEHLADATSAKEIITFMSAIGLDSKAIARVFKCSHEEIVERFAHEIDTAESQLISQMATGIVTAALKGSESALKFVLDRRGGEAWRPKTKRLEITPKMPAGDNLPTPTVEDREAARRAAVRAAVDGLSPEAREALQGVVDEMKVASARLLN